jgi:hypothetical protein
MREAQKKLLGITFVLTVIMILVLSVSLARSDPFACGQPDSKTAVIDYFVETNVIPPTPEDAIQTILQPVPVDENTVRLVYDLSAEATRNVAFTIKVTARGLWGDVVSPEYTYTPQLPKVVTLGIELGE